MIRILKQKNCFVIKQSLMNLFSSRRHNSKIQMLNNKLRAHLFDIKPNDLCAETNLNQDLDSLILPKLNKNNLNEHFLKISTDQIKSYKNILLQFKDIPKMPLIFNYSSGWTK